MPNGSRTDKPKVTLRRPHNCQAWLVPYAEGTLDPLRAALLEARLARDPALAAELAAIRAVTACLRTAGAHSTAEADPRLSLDPAPLWLGVQRRLTSVPRRLPRTAPWAGGVCAAALALGALLMHGSWPAGKTRHMPLAPPARVANARGAAFSPPAYAPHARHKKTGRRIASRPTHPAFGKSKTALATRLADRPKAALLPRPDAVLPAPTPAPDAPSPRTAVAWNAGQARFRLASPVREDKLGSAAHTAEGTFPSRQETNAPLPDNAVPSESPAPASGDKAADQELPAAASLDAPTPAPRAAHKTHRRRLRHRHHVRRYAASGAVAMPPVPVTPAGGAAGTHASRAV